MHLTPEELLDLADGTRTESSAPHLAACGECRTELADLRTMLSATANADVPDPSPLFWDHLSARVRQDVEAERAAVEGPGGIRVAEWFSWKVALPVAACLVALLAVSVTMRRSSGSPEVAAPAPVSTTADGASDGALSEDPSWQFVAGLAAELDWDAAIEAGIAPSGGVDRAVFDLSVDERRELQRLIEEEIERSKATPGMKS